MPVDTSLKEELRTWSDAVAHFKAEKFDDCLGAFELIADSAKILFNMGMVMQGLQRFEDAEISFTEAIDRDEYMAVAYFQRGVCFYIMENFEGAMEDFEHVVKLMRGNKMIDYAQLGLEYQLYSCEVLYNLALCKYRLGYRQEAATDLIEAVKDKVLDEHVMISQALDMVQNTQDPSEKPDEQQYFPFQVPAKIIYTPQKSKLDNSKKKDYLGKSKVVAAVNEGDSYTGFSGAKLRRGSEPEEENDQPRQYTSVTLSRGMMDSSTFPRAGNNRSLSRPRFETAPRQNMSPSQHHSSLGTAMRRPPGQMQFSMGRGMMNSPIFQSSPQMSPFNPPPPSMGSDGGFGAQQLNSGMNEPSVMTISRGGDHITVKCHYEDDIRKIAVAQDAAFESLVHQLHEKFQISDDRTLNIQYKDDDADMIRMKDDEDWNLALGATKVEIWVTTQ